MKHVATLLCAALMGAVGAAAAGGPALKIYHSDEWRTDTVYNPQFYVIAVTEPGATATIDGNECHVYRTGSFGARVTLKPGLNSIPVKATSGGRTSKETVTVVLAERPAAAAASKAQPAPVALDAPLTVVTRPGAYLQHGNGGDRLGGSKMNFLAEGIALEAIAETGNLYAVRLGNDDLAYVRKADVDVAPAAVDMQTVNTGSVSLSNTGKSDRIVVSLPRRLAYYDRSEIDPSTILVTLYGAANNSNWITQRGDLGMVDFIDMRRDGSDRLTLVLRLKEKFAWGYSVGYEGNNLVINVRHRPESLDVKDLTIGLDAGHGGPYPGAISPSGLTEKEVNLDIVLKAADILRGMGAKVVLTRDGDTGPSMAERKAVWLDGGVDIAVSVHNNSSGNPLVPMGTSAYYKHICNRSLAACLHRSMLGLDLANFGLTGNFNFSLNAPTEYPNALVEVLFMSSLPEEELLADPDYRSRLAEKIVGGLIDYLELVKHSL